MNPTDFQALMVAPEQPLHEALQRLDSTGRGLLMVVDHEGRLLRTVTDGDLRRARLQGLPDSAPVSQLPGHSPYVVHEDANAAAAWDTAEDLASMESKADIALRYAIKEKDWAVPRYIREGLTWLSEPPPPPAAPPPGGWSRSMT